MTIAKKLGKNFEKIQSEMQIKKISIDLGDVKFELKIKVPLKKEMEEINHRILSPSAEKIEAIYQKISAPMLATLEEGGEEFLKALNESGSKKVTKTDNDLILDGTSLRQVSQFSAIEESRVEEFFHLLLSESGEAIQESYDEISAEFPEFVIKEIVQSIQGAISPDYKAAKKN